MTKHPTGQTLVQGESTEAISAQDRDANLPPSTAEQRPVHPTVARCRTQLVPDKGHDDENEGGVAQEPGGMGSTPAWARSLSLTLHAFTSSLLQEQHGGGPEQWLPSKKS